ncbi:UNVERIFIED_CONTAM: hypothetical protein K2H54_021413 [Gekko kuhli]
MQRALNSQREEVSSSPQHDAPQPSTKRFTRPIANPKDESTQTNDLKKEFMQATKTSLQTVTESVQHNLPQPNQKLIRKYILNDVCTQMEPAHRISFVKSEPPQTQLLTTAKAPLQSEATVPAKTSLLPATTIEVSPQPEIKLRCRPESEFRGALHEVTRKNSLSPGAALPHRESLSTDNELRRNSLQKGSDPAHRGSFLTEPELRRSSLQAGPPLNQRGSLQKENWSAYEPAFHSESESEYRCPLHLEMEDTYPHTLSLGSEIPHRGSLSRKTETSLGISPGPNQECFPSSKNVLAQMEQFSSVSPCTEAKPVVRPCLYPSIDASLPASPCTEAALPSGIMPPRPLAKFGPQSPWWSLLQTDTHPPAPQEISRKITSPLVLEQNISPLPAEWMWQEPSSPTAPEGTHNQLSSLPPQEIMNHESSNPPVTDNGPTSPLQPPGEIGGRLDFPAESKTAWNSLRTDIPCQDAPKLEAPPDQVPTAADPGQGGRWLEHAGPSYETADRSRSWRGKSVLRFSASFMEFSDEMYTNVLWCLKASSPLGMAPPLDLPPKDEEIKCFLKYELAPFLKDYPSKEYFHFVPSEGIEKTEGVGHMEPKMFSSVVRTIPDESLVEKEQKAFHRLQPLDLQQQHMAALTLASSSRPRSPWGRLDPYNSDEDDKEYVGFATLPNQVHRKSVKKGFDFTLMVAGEAGLGKSTLVNSLFLTDPYKDCELLNAEERILQTVEITKHVVDIEEKGMKLRLTIVDTPGFGDAVNNTECWKPVANYIDQQFKQYFRDECGLNRKNIQDNRVHCCLYFISPFGHGLRPLDVEFMKVLHQRVNVVPVLAKADALTPCEVERMKSKIRDEIKEFGIRIYQFPDCDSDEDDNFKMQDQVLKESIPFAVIGSNTVVEAEGRQVRGRLYPWGVVEVENPAHCDFVKLRTMLVRTHMQDLKDVTQETHYENYRTQCIKWMTRMVVTQWNCKYVMWAMMVMAQGWGGGGVFSVLAEEGGWQRHGSWKCNPSL